MLVKLPTQERTLRNSFGPLPGDGPGADAAAADSGDGAAFGVVAELHGLLGLGQDLFEQEPCVPVRERVVLDAALAAALVTRRCRG